MTGTESCISKIATFGAAGLVLACVVAAMSYLGGRSWPATDGDEVALVGTDALWLMRNDEDVFVNVRILRLIIPLDPGAEVQELRARITTKVSLRVKNNGAWHHLLTNEVIRTGDVVEKDAARTTRRVASGDLRLDYSWGWPLRMIGGSIDVPRGFLRLTFLPMSSPENDVKLQRVLWLGLIINTIVFGVLTWGMALSARLVLHRSRQRSGRCDCGHTLTTEQLICPECGTPAKRRRGRTNPAR